MAPRPRRRNTRARQLTRQPMRFASLATALVLLLIAAPAAFGDQWYKTDTHVHSAVSGDATDDIGIIAKAAKDAGYDALFLTDHTATSNNEIGGVVSNHVTLDENDFQNWTSRAFGAPTSSVDAEASSPVNTGVKSLHLAATAGASAYGEQFRWYKRGPNLRTGDAILKSPSTRRGSTPAPGCTSRCRLAVTPRSPRGRRRATRTRPARSSPARRTSWCSSSATR